MSGCRDALMRCLKLAAAPFLAQIWLWVFHGHLQPLPADSLEFFIVSNKEGAGGALALRSPHPYPENRTCHKVSV